MDMTPKGYDLNFCFPIPEVIENDRLKLTPFIPSKHAHLFIQEARKFPEMFQYLPFGPFESVDDFLTNLIEIRVTPDPGYVMFVVFDKTTAPSSEENSEGGNGVLAGLFGLINTSTANLATEIGCIMIFPTFQRTHVASNATGLLLHYALDLPAAGGLGLRRVCWQANSSNRKSIRLAERMGFKMEGVIRWDRVLPEDKVDGNGIMVREGDPRFKSIGRDTALLSLCWDDWEDGGRVHVDAVMARLN